MQFKTCINIFFLFDGRVSRKLYKITCSVILLKVNGTVAVEYKYRLTDTAENVVSYIFIRFIYILFIFHIEKYFVRQGYTLHIF